MKTRLTLIRFAGLLLVLSGFGRPTSALAQSYSINWYKIAGGGGTSTNGQYSLSGTIGQQDAGGTLTGPGFALTGGFWSLFVVQTSGAPSLGIRSTQTNSVVVFWPSPSTGFSLQQNSNLSTTNWVAPAEIVNDDGTNRFIVVTPPVGSRYYRLKGH